MFYFRCHGSRNSNQPDSSFVFVLVIFLPPSSPIFIHASFPICQAQWIFSFRPCVSGFPCPSTMATNLFASSTFYISFSKTSQTVSAAGTGHLWLRVIHAAFSGHFEPISNFFVPHPATSIYLFSSSLSNVALDQLIDDLSFANCLLRELVSFHQFKGLGTPELLSSVLFSAADFLSVLLLVKFVRNVPPLIQSEQTVENPTFSPALSLITDNGAGPTNV